MYKSFGSTVPSPYGISRTLHPVRETAAIIAPKKSSTKADHTRKKSMTPIKPEQTIINSIPTLQAENTRMNTNFTMKPAVSASTFTKGTDWSPLDDGIGIDVTLPSGADPDDYINKVLYGPEARTRKRLPAFSAICPDF